MIMLHFLEKSIFNFTVVALCSAAESIPFLCSLFVHPYVCVIIY